MPSDIGENAAGHSQMALGHNVSTGKLLRFLTQRCGTAIVLIAGAGGAVPSQRAWLDVPYVEQVKNGCGSAAIAMLIQYWARQDTHLRTAADDSEAINRLLPPSSPRGIKGRELKQFLESRGFSAFIFDGELSDLRNHLDKGRPVLVCLALNGRHGPLHYVVIVGMDKTTVWMNDPARGKLVRDDITRFLTAWKETGNWTLLAVPGQAQR
jgi:uncharacterized protein YvpB